jgi:hypothetical protein
MPPPNAYEYVVDVEKGFMMNKTGGPNPEVVVHRSAASFKQKGTPVENQLAFSTVAFMEMLGTLDPLNPAHSADFDSTASYVVNETLEDDPLEDGAMLKKALEAVEKRKPTPAMLSDEGMGDDRRPASDPAMVSPRHSAWKDPAEAKAAKAAEKAKAAKK